MKQGMKFEPKCHQTCQIFDVLFQTVSCFVNRKSNLVIFFVPNHAKTCSFSARRSLVFFCSVFFFLLDAKILFRYFVHTFGFVFNTSTFQATLWLTRVRSRAFVWCCLQLVLCIYDWKRERKQFKQFLLANTWNIQSLDFRDSFDLNTSRGKKTHQSLLLPPCFPSLRDHAQRAIFWSQALMKNPKWRKWRTFLKMHPNVSWFAICFLT